MCVVLQVHREPDIPGAGVDPEARVRGDAAADSQHDHLPLVHHRRRHAAEPRWHPAQAPAAGGGVAQTTGVQPGRIH